MDVDCKELPLRRLFEEVTKYWSPKPKAQRRSSASSEALTAESESMAADEEPPLMDEGEVTQDLYMIGVDVPMSIPMGIPVSIPMGIPMGSP